MSLHPVRKGFMLASAALAGLSAAAALSPLSAQQALAEAQPGSPACRHFTADQIEAVTRCELREMDKRIEQNIQRGVEADKRAAAADQRSIAADRQMDLVALREACNNFLKAGRDANRWTTQDVVARAGGKMTPDKVCGVAKQLGYTGPTALLHHTR